MITTRSDEKVKLIDGPVGKLELAVGEGVGGGRDAWGIVCHPHSLHGGTMNNKVVTTLAKAMQNLGLRTIRFNFRGVGKSEGEFNQGIGELDDLMAVLSWMQQVEMRREIWLAGFSFGAYIALKAATQIPVNQLIVVAPPVINFSLNDLPPILSPWILAQGDKDEVVAAEDVYAWAEDRQPPPVILRFPEATHFFHGQLLALRTQLEEALTSSS